jgi:predicted RNA-binding Zn-ribbon protein involved in translation (DUF1610 family)
MANLCGWKKNKIDKKLDEYKELVRDAKFVCPKCGRAAHSKKSLCKPVKLQD